MGGVVSDEKGWEGKTTQRVTAPDQPHWLRKYRRALPPGALPQLALPQCAAASQAAPERAQRRARRRGRRCRSCPTRGNLSAQKGKGSPRCAPNGAPCIATRRCIAARRCHSLFHSLPILYDAAALAMRLVLSHCLVIGSEALLSGCELLAGPEVAKGRLLVSGSIRRQGAALCTWLPGGHELMGGLIDTCTRRRPGPERAVRRR